MRIVDDSIMTLENKLGITDSTYRRTLRYT